MRSFARLLFCAVEKPLELLKAVGAKCVFHSARLVSGSLVVHARINKNVPEELVFFVNSLCLGKTTGSEHHTLVGRESDPAVAKQISHRSADACLGETHKPCDVGDTHGL